MVYGTETEQSINLDEEPVEAHSMGADYPGTGKNMLSLPSSCKCINNLLTGCKCGRDDTASAAVPSECVQNMQTNMQHVESFARCTASRAVSCREDYALIAMMHLCVHAHV